MEEKITASASSPENVRTGSKKKRYFRFALKCVAAIFLVFGLLLASFGFWALQTASGQGWLTRQINRALEESLADQGFSAKITSLSGSLPFSFFFALEIADRNGTWLLAPDNEFHWSWRDLPQSIHIPTISFNDVILERLPHVPAAKPVQKTGPIDLPGLQEQLGKLGRSFFDASAWLPAVHIDNFSINRLGINRSILNGDTGGAGYILANLRSSLAGDLHGLGNVAGSEHISGESPAKKDALFTLDLDLSGKSGETIDLSGFQSSGISSSLVLLVGQTGRSLEARGNLDLEIHDPQVRVEGLPENLAGNSARVSLGLKASAEIPDAGPLSAISLGLSGPDVQAGPLFMSGSTKWNSANSSWPDGPIRLDYTVNLDIARLSELAANDKKLAELAGILPKPAELALVIGGSLPEPEFKLNLNVPVLFASGKEIRDIQAQISTNSLIFPDFLSKKLMPVLSANISLKGAALDKLFGLNAECHLSPLNQDKEILMPAAGSFRAGFRDLEIQLAGISGTGSMEALIYGDRMPSINGAFHLDATGLKSLSDILPDYDIGGSARLDIELNDQDGNAGQTGKIAFAMKNILFGQNGKSLISLSGLTGNVLMSDIFADGIFSGQAALSGLRVNEYQLNAKAAARGAIKGPINVKFDSSGSLGSQFEAEWKPGLVSVRKLLADFVFPKKNSSKGEKISLRSQHPLLVKYGDGGIGVEHLDLQITPAGRIKADGEISKDRLSFVFSLNALKLDAWQKVLPALPTGNASARVSLTGRPGSPKGSYEIGMQNLKLKGTGLAPLSFSVRGGIENKSGKSALSGRLDISESSRKALGTDKAVCRVLLPLKFAENGLPGLDMEGNVSGNIIWDGAIRPLWNLVPFDGRRLNGRIVVNINASGVMRSPTVDGTLQVVKARFEDILLGVLLNDINMKLELAGFSARNGDGGESEGIPGSMSLLLTAGDGLGGSMRIAGKGNLDGKKLDILASLNHLKPLRRRDVQISLSGDAKVAGAVSAPDISGKILINQGEILLDNIAMGSSVATLPISTASGAPRRSGTAKNSPESSGKKNAPGSLDVSISSPRRFIVEGRGLTSEWEAHLLLGGSPFAPTVTGQLNAVKGNFDFLGKIFSLTKGTVTFAGGSISNPLINIVLTNQTPDLLANLDISGPANRIRLTLSSDPSMPRDEILSHVLFGRGVHELSRLEALQMAAAVAQLAGFSTTGGILNSAKKALGVDVLRLGTSPSGAMADSGDDSGAGTTLEMGKYINDMIYMGVQQGMKPDSTAFIIQLEMTPRTSLEIRSEQQNTWGGLKWKYNY